eukprot:TRINITY_DN5325_c0_g1_i2.p1 TRINITY_DN5325_c0_g1~~TRINITY_DN5325_c0_g1_i2.p1  ORF type:complete len:775 (+),score=121.98 TRINITY_DN5325_c0_g1_i2:65-2389(+)
MEEVVLRDSGGHNRPPIHHSHHHARRPSVLTATPAEGGSDSPISTSGRDNESVVVDGDVVRIPSTPKNLKRKPAECFGQYQLGQIIGRGGYGTVHKGLNLNTGEIVAIKRFKQDKISQQSAALTQVKSEANMLRDLQSNFVVKFHGYVKRKRRLYFVMEYMEEGSLASMVENYGPMTERLAAIYVAQVLQGLQYLHSRHIVHRDIKGSNILLSKSGSVKLGDFGVSATMRDNEKRFSVVGTPFWMAPEVVEMSGHSIHSDIWSVGSLVSELVTGEPPYFNQPPMAAMFRLVSDAHPPIPSTVSTNLQSFLAACWKKPASDRPLTDELLEHPWITSNNRAVSYPFLSGVPESPISLSTIAATARGRANSSPNSVNLSSSDGFNQLSMLRGFGDSASAGNSNISNSNSSNGVQTCRVKQHQRRSASSVRSHSDSASHGLNLAGSHRTRQSNNRIARHISRDLSSEQLSSITASPRSSAEVDDSTPLSSPSVSWDRRYHDIGTSERERYQASKASAPSDTAHPSGAVNHHAVAPGVGATVWKKLEKTLAEKSAISRQLDTLRNEHDLAQVRANGLALKMAEQRERNEEILAVARAVLKAKPSDGSSPTMSPRNGDIVALRRQLKVLLKETADSASDDLAFENSFSTPVRPDTIPSSDPIPVKAGTRRRLFTYTTSTTTSSTKLGSSFTDKKKTKRGKDGSNDSVPSKAQRKAKEKGKDREKGKERDDPEKARLAAGKRTGSMNVLLRVAQSPSKVFRNNHIDHQQNSSPEFLDPSVS